MEGVLVIAEGKVDASSQADMTFTGERVVEGKTPYNLYEDHLLRYQLAAERAADKVVLDVACGSGYGAYLLCQSGAECVVGVDLSAEAIAYARGRYVAPNLRFLVGSADNIPLRDHSVELITCFETLEHVRDFEALLAEVTRILRPDGALCLSTPNRRVSSPGRNFADPPVNPYHVHEFTHQELTALLESRFGRVITEGQKFLPRILVLPPMVMLKRFRRPDRWPNEMGSLSPFREPFYFISWCSLPKPVLRHNAVQKDAVAV
jgi:ubiquinone/menaquinone biosynthesis C-methylase UbiE